MGQGSVQAPFHNMPGGTTLPTTQGTHTVWPTRAYVEVCSGHAWHAVAALRVRTFPANESAEQGSGAPDSALKRNPGATKGQLVAPSCALVLLPGGLRRMEQRNAGRAWGCGRCAFVGGGRRDRGVPAEWWLQFVFVAAMESTFTDLYSTTCYDTYRWLLSG